MILCAILMQSNVLFVCSSIGSSYNTQPSKSALPCCDTIHLFWHCDPFTWCNETIGTNPLQVRGSINNCNANYGKLSLKEVQDYYWSLLCSDFASALQIKDAIVAEGKKSGLKMSEVVYQLHLCDKDYQSFAVTTTCPSAKTQPPPHALFPILV